MCLYQLYIKWHQTNTLFPLAIAHCSLFHQVTLQSLRIFRIAFGFGHRCLKDAKDAANSPPPNVPSPRNKGLICLIAGLMKGNHWLISPDHKALFLEGVCKGGVGWPAITDGQITSRHPKWFSWIRTTTSICRVRWLVSSRVQSSFIS